MEENNKIIAEFMGFTFEKNIGYYDNEMLLEQIVYEQQNGNCFDELLFNKDWNWLMAVVEKIENIKIKDYSISTDITNNKTFINVWHYGDGGKWSILISNLNEEYKDFNKIQRTYKAIIEFINFYNKQKEE